VLAVAHAGRGGRSTSSWVAGCVGLDDGYTEWVNQGLPVAVGHPRGADRAVSEGWGAQTGRFAGFLHRFYMIPDHDRYTWEEVWGYPRRNGESEKE